MVLVRLDPEAVLLIPAEAVPKVEVKAEPKVWEERVGDEEINLYM